MKKLNVKIIFTALISAFILSSCLKDNDNIGYYPQAAFTMVNAYSPSESIIYNADQNAIQSPMNPLVFKSYTFANLFPGNRRIQTFSSNNKTLVDTLYAFRDSTYYTSFVYGTYDTPKHIISTDKLLTGLENKSGIRFLHLANNIGAVNVYIGNNENPVFNNRLISENLNTTETIFTPHNSGKQKIVIKDEVTNTTIEREYDFAPGIHYTIILIGDKENANASLYIGIIKQY